MGFEGLLGNERLKENLRSSIHKGRISHFYVISGPAGSGKRTLARLLAAAILCKTGADRPCGVCDACRKVLGAGHPDYITVDDPEKKTVPVELIRQARADIYIRPNESNHKIYLFPRGQDMADPSQNALLKVLEEPPAYGVFILLTDNPEKLLTTVRSRCTELSLAALPENLLLPALKQRFPQADQETLRAAAARSGGYLGQAAALLAGGISLPPQTQAFLAAYTARDTLGLLQLLTSMEKLKRDQLQPLLEQWCEHLCGALALRSGGQSAFPMARELSASRSAAELNRAIGHLQKSIEYIQGNTSPATICGYLVWALR